MKPVFAFLLAASCAFTLPAAEPATPPAEQKKPDVDWGALFKLHWENRVKSFTEQNLALQNVVLVGDSITEGFDLQKYLPGRRVLNRGIGADIIGNDLPPADPRGVLRRLDSSVFDCSATDVFLMIGINDLNLGHTVDQMEAGYRALLAKIKAGAPKLRVHVQSVLPTRGDHTRQNAPVREFNTRLRKLAAEFGYDYLDLHALLADERGELKAEFTDDGLHLKEPAYRLWQAEILRVMGW